WAGSGAGTGSTTTRASGRTAGCARGTWAGARWRSWWPTPTRRGERSGSGGAATNGRSLSGCGRFRRRAPSWTPRWRSSPGRKWWRPATTITKANGDGGGNA
ncbi:MAG: hypothetical protein AVDCRST_MAG01-01-3283, partial [uncultured Rubrobacteraceae bacterium]